MTRIAFIGAGNMGLPMLRNLLAAGHEVRAYDVSPDALAEAEQAGASEAVGLADAVTEAEMVVTMVPEGRHVRAVYLGDGGNDGIIGHAPRVKGGEKPDQRAEQNTATAAVGVRWSEGVGMRPGAVSAGNEGRA